MLIFIKQHISISKNAIFRHYFVKVHIDMKIEQFFHIFEFFNCFSIIKVRFRIFINYFIIRRIKDLISCYAICVIRYKIQRNFKNWFCSENKWKYFRSIFSFLRFFVFAIFASIVLLFICWNIHQSQKKNDERSLCWYENHCDHEWTIQMMILKNYFWSVCRIQIRWNSHLTYFEFL